MRNGIVMLVLVAATAALLYVLITPTAATTKPYSQFYQDVTKGRVAKVEITDMSMKVTLNDTTGTTYTALSDLPADGEFATIQKWLTASGLGVNSVTYQRNQPPDTS